MAIKIEKITLMVATETFCDEDSPESKTVTALDYILPAIAGNHACKSDIKVFSSEQEDMEIIKAVNDGS